VGLEAQSGVGSQAGVFTRQVSRIGCGNRRGEGGDGRGGKGLLM